MAEQQQQQQITALDAPASGQSRTGRAVALARLLHYECTRLFQLYKERETFLDHTLDHGRLVSLSPNSEEPSTEEQVQLLHSALRKCLGLLQCVILKEEEEWGKLEDDYETMRDSVRFRIEGLLHTTKDLVEADGANMEVTPDHNCTEETDGALKGFDLKKWTYQVLQELIHWADHAAQTLHVLHVEREGTNET
uniref:Uncharacterized protein n=1 Tax=Anabas testudineus TaxID=64144 RepID=A0A3Q1J2P3_ANATE